MPWLAASLDEVASPAPMGAASLEHGRPILIGLGPWGDRGRGGGLAGESRPAPAVRGRRRVGRRMTPLERFLADHGLIALLVIATVEGDLSVLVGGVLAHLGLLSLPGVAAAGALGNLLGDCVWFATGRRLRDRIRGGRLYRAVGPGVERLAGKLGPWQLLAARVVWGTRNASMVFWGQHGLGLGRFLLINGLGCVLAATGFALLGYGVGHGTALLAGEVKRVEQALLVGVVVGGLLIWGISRWARRQGR